MKIPVHPDVRIHQHNVHYDFRGELWTLWKQDEFYPKLDFNHDKVSTSRKHVLRGIHGDTKSWKLIEWLIHIHKVELFQKLHGECKKKLLK